MATVAGLLTTDISRYANEGEIPHEDLPRPIKAVILRAISDAWSDVRARVGEDLATSKETDLTAALKHHLNRIREEEDPPSGFRGSLFEVVATDSTIPAYDGSSLEKRPDLIFRFIAHGSVPFSEHKALFVECKPVGPGHPISVYGKKGLVRFVKGEYAWAMPSAMMIGYARGGRSVPKTLRPHLKKHQGEDDPYRTLSMPRRAAAPLPEGTYVTEHDRPWLYQETERSPGRIALLHLWLKAD